MLWYFGHKACGILAPRPGIKATPLASEGEEVFTSLDRQRKALWFSLSAAHVQPHKIVPDGRKTKKEWMEVVVVR